MCNRDEGYSDIKASEDKEEIKRFIFLLFGIILPNIQVEQIYKSYQQYLNKDYLNIYTFAAIYYEAEIF